MNTVVFTKYRHGKSGKVSASSFLIMKYSANILRDLGHFFVQKDQAEAFLTMTIAKNVDILFKL